MPIFHNFKSTNVWKAFTLNSILSALVIFIAITIKEKFDIYVDNKNHVFTRKTTWEGVFFTLFLTFLASMLSYIFMYVMFGFGGGMLTQ